MIAETNEANIKSLICQDKIVSAVEDVQNNVVVGWEKVTSNVSQSEMEHALSTIYRRTLT